MTLEDQYFVNGTLCFSDEGIKYSPKNYSS